MPHAAATAPPAAALPPSQGGAWSVQVTATRDPRTADDVLKRLRARGYDAYIVRVRREGATFYRVRVGHFPSMEYASQLVSRLRREPGVPEAFVASD
ncbi:MAG: SPOR domain-containing protein [Deltaproteobacteria bacterium]|nr:MAG: SPOR domain-containing protein [Deltaproteobacteria bacterium]